MRMCELREKEVINCCDGQRLGYICDIDFNSCTGCIEKVIIPGPCKIFGIIGRDHEYIIPFNCIKQIGNDVILVDLNIEDYLVKCKV